MKHTQVIMLHILLYIRTILRTHKSRALGGMIICSAIALYAMGVVGTEGSVTYIILSFAAGCFYYFGGRLLLAMLYHMNKIMWQVDETLENKRVTIQYVVQLAGKIRNKPMKYFALSVVFSFLWLIIYFLDNGQLQGQLSVSILMSCIFCFGWFAFLWWGVPAMARSMKKHWEMAD